jgi:hypothetical protein
MVNGLPVKGPGWHDNETACSSCLADLAFLVAIAAGVLAPPG